MVMCVMTDDRTEEVVFGAKTVKPKLALHTSCEVNRSDNRGSVCSTVIIFEMIAQTNPCGNLMESVIY